MSAASIAVPHMSNNMQDQAGVSPRTQQRLQHNKGYNQHVAAQYTAGAMSDSSLPQSRTPKTKKPARQKQQGERAASVAVANSKQATEHAYPQRTRPASVAGPNHGTSSTPVKAAYAGPTFHASPAPSSLPVPRFFSKSVPGPDGGLQARLEKETEKADGSDSDATLLAPPSRNTQQSPLDMFFKADRAERAQRQSGGFDAQVRPVSGSETPERQQNNMQGTSGKDMFMMELDESDSPVGNRSTRPAPPGPRRMTSERSRTAPENVPTLSQEEEQNAEFTKSLKSLLGLTSSGSSIQTGSPARSGPEADNEGSPFAPRYGQQGPSTPQHKNYGQPSNNFHYGNRNLSPLFQAARQDSPSRPSTLRQEFHPSPDQPNLRSPSQNDHSAIARTQLQQRTSEIQPQQLSFPSRQQQYASQQQQFAPTSQQNGSPARSPNPPSAFRSLDNAVQQGFPDGQQQQQGSPGSRDVKSMEDNLRRILKLNVS